MLSASQFLKHRVSSVPLLCKKDKDLPSDTEQDDACQKEGQDANIFSVLVHGATDPIGSLFDEFDDSDDDDERDTPKGSGTHTPASHGHHSGVHTPKSPLHPPIIGAILPVALAPLAPLASLAPLHDSGSSDDSELQVCSILSLCQAS